ncbi:MAG: alginate lyase family protein, partial [Planctomycetota bacterium]
TAWLAFRAGYALRKRLGLLRAAMPMRAWDDLPLSDLLADPDLAEPDRYLDHRRSADPRFFFGPADRRRYAPLLAQWGGSDASERAERIRQGHFLFFSHRDVHAGFPPDWHRNYDTGRPLPAHVHWSRIPDFGEGDIKYVWELSRFGFAYTLVRAYWRTGDDGHAETFWRLVEDWRTRNPPNHGANWACGQEITFRLMAWCFGLYGFLGAAATTPHRVAALAQMIGVSARRIDANIGYALSQQNNHGISEAVGLCTAGTLFPEFADSRRWRERGARLQARQAAALVYDDGSFSQHSTNYHRLMLHDLIWAARLGELNDDPAPPDVNARIRAAVELLWGMLDAGTGQAPAFGHNDGALVLPLSHSDFWDFRPVVQSGFFLTEGRRRLEAGPWDEELLWLHGDDALDAEAAEAHQADLEAPHGGWYVLRSPSGFAATHCARFRHRPAHADLLHVDLWRHGRNVAQDAGTFSYHAPPPWDNALAGAGVHNTGVIDGRDQMERAGRFLYLPWASGRVRCFQRSERGQLGYWEGEHDGYRRLRPPAVHRRALLQMPENVWLVLDWFSCRQPRTYTVHWLLSDARYEWSFPRLRLEYPEGPYDVLLGCGSHAIDATLARAEANSTRGWRSRRYGEREPALSLRACCQAEAATVWTVFGPKGTDLEDRGGSLSVWWPGGCAEIVLAGEPPGLLISQARVSGDVEDSWEAPR